MAGRAVSAIVRCHHIASAKSLPPHLLFLDSKWECFSCEKRSSGRAGKAYTITYFASKECIISLRGCGGIDLTLQDASLEE